MDRADESSNQFVNSQIREFVNSAVGSPNVSEESVEGYGWIMRTSPH